MRLALLALLLAIPACTISQSRPRSEVFSTITENNKRIALRLYMDMPCINAEVLKHLIHKVSPEFLAKFKAATLTWGGRDWASCWIDFRGMVFSIDEEGSLLQPLPRDRFRDEAI